MPYNDPVDDAFVQELLRRVRTDLAAQRGEETDDDPWWKKFLSNLRSSVDERGAAAVLGPLGNYGRQREDAREWMGGLVTSQAVSLPAAIADTFQGATSLGAGVLRRMSEPFARAFAEGAGRPLIGEDAFGSDFAERAIEGSREFRDKWLSETAPSLLGFDEEPPTSLKDPRLLGLITGPMLAEMAKYYFGGNLIRAAAPLKGTWLGTRSGNILGEALKDAAAVSPMDLSAAADPTYSTAGFLADIIPEDYESEDQLTQEFVRGIQGLASKANESYLGRAAFEVLPGFGLDVGLRGAMGALRSAGKVVSKNVDAIEAVKSLDDMFRSGFEEGEQFRTYRQTRKAQVRAIEQVAGHLMSPENLERPRMKRVVDRDGNPTKGWFGEEYTFLDDVEGDWEVATRMLTDLGIDEDVAKHVAFTLDRKVRDARLKLASEGRLTPEAIPGAKGVTGRKLEEIPGEVYHATTDVEGVKRGGLKTGQEVGEPPGLGGTENAVSLTTDQELAFNIARSIVELHGILNMPYEDALRMLKEAAEEGRGATKPYPTSHMRAEDHWDRVMSGMERKNTDMQPHSASEMPEGSVPAPGQTPVGPPEDPKYFWWMVPMSEEDRTRQVFEVYREWALTRDMAGGPPDALFFGWDTPLKIRDMDPSNVGVLRVTPAEGAFGEKVQSMGEYRVTSTKGYGVEEMPESLKGRAERAALQPKLMHSISPGAYSKKYRRLGTRSGARFYSRLLDVLHKAPEEARTIEGWIKYLNPGTRGFSLEEVRDLKPHRFAETRTPYDTWAERTGRTGETPGYFPELEDDPWTFLREMAYDKTRKVFRGDHPLAEVPITKAEIIEYVEKNLPRYSIERRGFGVSEEMSGHRMEPSAKKMEKSGESVVLQRPPKHTKLTAKPLDKDGMELAMEIEQELLEGGKLDLDYIITHDPYALETNRDLSPKNYELSAHPDDPMAGRVAFTDPLALMGYAYKLAGEGGLSDDLTMRLARYLETALPIEDLPGDMPIIKTELDMIQEGETPPKFRFGPLSADASESWTPGAIDHREHPVKYTSPVKDLTSYPPIGAEGHYGIDVPVHVRTSRTQSPNYGKVTISEETQADPFQKSRDWWEIGDQVEREFAVEGFTGREAGEAPDESRKMRMGYRKVGSSQAQRLREAYQRFEGRIFDQMVKDLGIYPEDADMLLHMQGFLREEAGDPRGSTFMSHKNVMAPEDDQYKYAMMSWPDEVINVDGRIISLEELRGALDQEALRHMKAIERSMLWLHSAPMVMPMRKGYVRLGVGVSIEEAVRNGDRTVVFTPGEIHVQRYGTDHIEFQDISEAGEGPRFKVKIKAAHDARVESLDPDLFAGMEMPPVFTGVDSEVTSLDELYRTGIAAGMFPGNPSNGYIRMMDIWDRMLREGGGVIEPRREGMHIAYDQRVLKEVKWYARQLGGKFVDDIEVPGWYGVKGFGITDLPAQKIRTEGLPVYAKFPFGTAGGTLVGFGMMDENDTWEEKVSKLRMGIIGGLSVDALRWFRQSRKDLSRKLSAIELQARDDMAAKDELAMERWKAAGSQGDPPPSIVAAAERMQSKVAKGGERLVPKPANVFDGDAKTRGGKLLSRALNWARFKITRGELPMEMLDKLVKGDPVTGEKVVRNVLARGRGYMTEAEEFMARTLAPMIEGDQELMSAAIELGKAERIVELVEVAGKKIGDEALQDARLVIEGYKGNREVHQAMGRIRQYYRRLLDMRRAEGVISDRTYFYILRQGHYYLPFVPEELAQLTEGFTGAGKLYVPNQSSGIRAMGEAITEQMTVDPYTLAVKDTYETFQQIHRQHLSDALGGYLKSYPEAMAPFIKFVPRTFDSKSGLKLPVQLDGKRKYVHVSDPNLINAWSSIYKRDRESAFTMASNHMRMFMQKGVTLNPVFIMRNAVRDFFMSAVQYELMEGVPLAGKLSHTFGSAPVAGAGTLAGGVAGVATKDPEEDALDAFFKGSLAASAGMGGLHLTRHAFRTAAALHDIVGADGMGMMLGATGGFIFAPGDEDTSYLGRMGWALGTAAFGGFMGFTGGHVLQQSFGESFRGNREAYRQFLREGGGQFGLMRSTKQDAERMVRLMKEEGGDVNEILSPEGWGHAVQMVMHPINMIHEIAKAVETAPRLARWKTVRARQLPADFGVDPKLASVEKLAKKSGVSGETVARRFADQEAIAAAGLQEKGFKGTQEDLDYAARGVIERQNNIYSEIATELRKRREMAVGNAVFDARDLSLDFAVHGQGKAVGHLRKATPFLNPMLIGIDKMVRMMNMENGSVAAMTIIAPSVALWMLNHMDDEVAREYASRPQQERGTYWLMPNKVLNKLGLTDKASGFMRVPKPFELGWLYGTTVENVLDTVYEYDRAGVALTAADWLGEMGDQLLQFHGSFMSPSLPMWAVPIAAGAPLGLKFGAGHGFDPFSKRPIDPFPWMNIDPELQRTPYTSSVATAMFHMPGVRQMVIAAGFNTPAKIDFAIRAYGGTLAAEASQAITSLAQETGLDRRPDAPPRDKAFVRAFETNDLVSSQYESDFRNDFQGYEAAWNTLQLLVSREPENVEAYLANADKDVQERITMYQIAVPFKNRIDDLTALRRNIRNSTTVHADLKEAMMREITLTIGGVALTFNRINLRVKAKIRDPETELGPLKP